VAHPPLDDRRVNAFDQHAQLSGGELDMLLPADGLNMAKGLFNRFGACANHHVGLHKPDGQTQWQPYSECIDL
jgi:hypothetical protein